jgi:hypothetical protein
MQIDDKNKENVGAIAEAFAAAYPFIRPLLAGEFLSDADILVRVKNGVNAFLENLPEDL